MGKLDTWHALQLWGGSSTDSEYMTADLLEAERYESIDPVHPHGGPDGLKDIVLRQGRLTFVCACYFSKEKQTFGTILKKFEHDLAGRRRQSADGFIFSTNQVLSDGERDKLTSAAIADGARVVQIYHLERLRVLLDSPRGLHIRLRYLEIPMTHEEQLAYFGRLHDRQEQIFEAKLRDGETRMKAMIREVLAEFAAPAAVDAFMNRLDLARREEEDDE